MKVVVINGSARKGNTLCAINAFIEGAKDNNEIEIIEAHTLNLKACMGCDACANSKGCVALDDTNETVDKIVNADMILFASPVYWWGITGQMKLLIDKCYSKGNFLRGKKIGVIAIGADALTGIQYELIRKQFECIAAYLSWEILFNKSYSAGEKNDLAKQEKAIAELKKLGESIN